MTLGGKIHYVVDSHRTVCGLDLGPLDVKNEDSPKDYPTVTNRWDLVTCGNCLRSQGV